MAVGDPDVFLNIWSSVLVCTIELPRHPSPMLYTLSHSFSQLCVIAYLSVHWKLPELTSPVEETLSHQPLQH